MENSSLDWPTLADASQGIAKQMHEAGVPLLAGTDLGVMGVFPGSGLHTELVMMVNALGLTPLEALQAATRNAAGGLGWKRKLGSISVGKQADLVLLDADPPLDIRHVARIHMVISRGVDYGPEQRSGLRAAILLAQSR